MTRTARHQLKTARKPQQSRQTRLDKPGGRTSCALIVVWQSSATASYALSRVVGNSRANCLPGLAAPGDGRTPLDRARPSGRFGSAGYLMNMLIAALVAILPTLLARAAPADESKTPPAAERKARVAKNPREHWAFKPPVRPNAPKVKGKSWVRNPIDSFILARLEKEKLKPAPEADKVTLLRRLSLDLIGLPPTIAEVDAFLADRNPGAYEKQVERLLNSPHYGERWGRHWLDAARYADSDGYEKDMSRNVWAYRDYVINAFNRDLPYDQFIIEQFAGDQLPNATQDQRDATGFLRNSMLTQEGPIDPEQFRMDAMFDRMDAIVKV